MGGGGGGRTMRCLWLLVFFLFDCSLLFTDAEPRFRGQENGVRFVGHRSNYNDGVQNLAPLFNNLQRRNWCARWGDYCVPDSKVKFANCCSGLRCICGTFLWNPGKCQCKKSSLFGR